MNSIRSRLSVITAAAAFVGLTSCMQPERVAVPTRASHIGRQFAAVGEVTLHPGQPCASQIMFDFHPGDGPIVQLAAPKRESKLLTEAANRHRRVRVEGNWRSGTERDCSYISVTAVGPL